MDKDAKLLEKQGYDFLVKQELYEAYQSFKEAAIIYKEQGNHKESSICFASAASCWALKSGEKAFDNAAFSYEQAAKEAKKAGDFEYASLLYKFAAVNYERDLEFINFSDCFYASREAYRKFLWLSLFSPRKIRHVKISREQSAKRSFLRRLFSLVFLTFSAFFWGHGERPFRTLIFAFFLIFIFAFFYTFGYLMQIGIIFQPKFLEALYFSVITFTTVGFGDIVPVGDARILAAIEAFCALFTGPLLVVGLTRKYLRV